MRRATAAAILIGAAFVAGVLYLFGVQFAAGDVYPEYSSLRSDPGGAKLLFDALARTPGVTAARNYVPLEAVHEKGAAILLLAIPPEGFAENSELQVRLEKLARSGNRIVCAMAYQKKEPKLGSLYRNWDVKFATDHAKGSHHPLYFSEAKDWRVLEQAGGKMLTIERAFGDGSIVLAAESDDFSNQATAASDRLDAVTRMLGPCTRVVFDEQHFGIAETGSIVGLARRFRLTGLAVGLGICAALFLWRSASPFPRPAESAAAERLAGRTSHAGLLTLLRRHVPRGELVQVCWRTWANTNRRTIPAERAARAEAIATGAADPVRAVREIQAVLEKKGEL